MKKIILILTICLLMINSIGVSSAVTQPVPVTMYFNGYFVSSVVHPFIKDDLIYVPLRTFADLFEATDIEWNKEDRSVEITYETKSIKLFIDQNKVLVNGNEFTIEGQPTIIDGYTMVPLDFIRKNFGCDASWDQLTYSVLIKSDVLTINRNDKGSYTMEDVLWLSRIVQVEGGGTSDACKLAIANVVLNRVKSNGVFPGTVYGVIFQAGRFPQFPPAHKEGFTEILPRADVISIAKRALNGENNIGKCLYFNNSPFKSKADSLYTIIDGEYFYN